MTTLTVQRGFTLVEVVTVIVILGIIAAVAMPRFFDNDLFLSRGTAEQVKAALRYGQKVAIAQHRVVTVNFTSAADSNCNAVLAAGGVINCVISSNVAVAPALPSSYAFNALGQPVPNAAAAISVGATTISIEAETGYVR